MSYELIVWPVDRAMTTEEAIAEVEHFSGGLQFGFGHDGRLDAFVEAMRERYPGLHGNEEHRPFEFDVMRKHVFVAVPDSAAAQVAAVVAESAWSAGVASRITGFGPRRRGSGVGIIRLRRPDSPFRRAPLAATPART